MNNVSIHVSSHDTNNDGKFNEVKSLILYKHKLCIDMTSSFFDTLIIIRCILLCLKLTMRSVKRFKHRNIIFSYESVLHINIIDDFKIENDISVCSMEYSSVASLDDNRGTILYEFFGITPLCFPPQYNISNAGPRSNDAMISDVVDRDVNSVSDTNVCRE